MLVARTVPWRVIGRTTPRASRRAVTVDANLLGGSSGAAGCASGNACQERQSGASCAHNFQIPTGSRAGAPSSASADRQQL
jgi:hypothetical protein